MNMCKHRTKGIEVVEGFVKKKVKLVCPICFKEVKGWKIRK